METALHFLCAIARLDNRVRRLSSDTALVDAALEADVALLSPRRAPGVLDDPVGGVGGGVSAIADDEHTVVELFAARGVRQDAARIELEALLVSFDGNGHRSDVDSGQKFSLASNGDINILADGGSNSLILLALAILSSVGVGSLSGDTLFLMMNSNA